MILERSYEEALEKLGLAPKEIRVYVTLLKEGPSSVRQLAAVTAINRGTVYDALKNLQAMGLARFYNKETKQYFVAAEPGTLRELAGRRIDDLTRAQDKLTHVIAELETVYDGGAQHPVARMYEGADGVGKILADVLSSMEASDEKEYYVYSSSSVRDALYTSFPDYTKQRLAAGIRVKNISIGKGGKTAGLDERKWIPATEGAPTYILMYASKVANIFMDKRSGELMGLIVENKGIYETQKLLFLSLWERI
jgi:sugar-specific transcriptional regulator TrmB